MPGSLLLTLTASAVALLLPVVFGLLRAQSPTRAARHAGTSRGRVAVPAVAVGVGGALTGALAALLLGAGPLLVVANALVLAGAVAVPARGSGSWRMPRVVAWALLMTATVAFLAWLGLQVLGVADTTATVGGAVAWLLLGLALMRITPYAREMVGRSSRREPLASEPAAMSPPLGWLVTGAASMALLLAFGVGAAMAPDEQPSQAAEEDGSSESRPSAGPQSSPSASPSPDRPSPTLTETGTPGGRATRRAAASPGPEPATAPQEAEPEQPQAEAPQPTKTPGWAKDKPNRPADAPTPGSGRRGSS